jgi:Ca2+:H+ antiporter
LGTSKSEPISGADPQTTTAPSVEPSVSEKPPKAPVMKRFLFTFKSIIFHSWLNVMLIFVPVGIAVHFAHLPAGIIFAMNAIAIIPLAGLLSHATEVVAASLGDSIGALLNVTFGNAVELIILWVPLPLRLLAHGTSTNI